MILALDVETFSSADLKRIGAAAYAEHPSTGVHCAVMVLGAEKCRWTPAATVLPAWAKDHIAHGGLVLAHNAGFEAAIIQHVLAPRYNWPEPTPQQWCDSAALAAALALPVTLAGLGATLGTPVKKDEEGAKLMRSLATRETCVTGAELERLLDYCEQDVLAMLACWQRLPGVTLTEEALLAADREINRRGALIDRQLAAAMRRLAQRRATQIDTEVWRVSEDLIGASSLPALKTWLGERGVELPKVRRSNGTSSTTLSRDIVTRFAADEKLPDDVRAVMRLRAEAGKIASLAKLTRVPELTSKDGRLRGSLQYCGAHTGRWTSRGLQVHNLPRSRFTPEQLDKLRELALAQNLPEFASAAAPHSPLAALSQLLRSLVIAPPGRDLIGGDFSAIEARVLAWLAGQDDVLAAYDDPTRDVYLEDAEKVGAKDNRELGKRCRLGLGYGMGAVKFSRTAATFGDGLVLPLKDAQRITTLWRAANPMIVDFWFDLETAAHHAVTRHETTTLGKLHVVPGKRCLRIILPSGRALHYWRPSVERVTRRLEYVTEEGEYAVRDIESTELRFFTASRDARSMSPEGTYGGKLTENVTQAVARDLLAEALLRLRHSPYSVVLHVHDSVVAEVAEGAGSVDEFCQILTASPEWATGLPVAAKGYRGKHFRG